MASELEQRRNRFKRVIEGLHDAGSELVPGAAKAVWKGLAALTELSSAADLDAAIASLEAEAMVELLEAMARTLAELDAGQWDQATALAGLRDELLGQRWSYMRELVGDDELAKHHGKLIARHESIKMLGFMTTARVSFKLGDVHVPLDAYVDRRGRGKDVGSGAQIDDLACEDVEGDRIDRLPLADAFRWALRRGRRGLVLLGEPGSGKTTCLKQITLKVCSEGPESVGLPAGTTVVLVTAQAVHALIASNPHAGLPELVREATRDRLRDIAPDFGERLCRRGRVLLMVDGLDEVAHAAARELVSRTLESLHDASLELYLMVSCRYSGYSRGKVELHEQFLEFQIKPLDDAQMREFVCNWYETIETQIHRDVDPERASERASERAEALIRELLSPTFAAARVYAMTRNPLLLTGICLVHQDRGKLPRARAKLYEECIAVLLERRAMGIDKDEALDVLQPLAAFMHEKRLTRATRETLLDPLVTTLARVGASIDAPGFFNRIRDDAGLLTGFDMDNYGFMHLGFQEFLTAKHIRNRANDDANAWLEIVRRFEQPWWQEVILLLLALRDPAVFDPFMRMLIEQPEFSRWADSSLMSLCLDDANGKTATPFAELLERADPRPRWKRALGLGHAGAEGLAARQLAAARVLAQHMPDALAERVELLHGHWHASVREWARGRASDTSLRLDARTGIEFVCIPAGEHWMGSSARVGHPNEHPRHRVTLAAFELARTPLTNEQYRHFLEAHPQLDKPRYWSDRRYNQPNQPVVGVSWYAAMAYCEWAGLVLPTEAQWEVACQAGSDTQYCNGDTIEHLDGVGWYGKNSDGRLHGAMQKQPNAWGLYDMHGNVWEWCLDGWGAYDGRVRGKNGLRRETHAAETRVARGGSWYANADCARSAFRVGFGPSYCVDDLGFRPAMVIPGNFTNP